MYILKPIQNWDGVAMQAKRVMLLTLASGQIKLALAVKALTK